MRLHFFLLRNSLPMTMIHPGAVLRYRLSTEMNDESFQKLRPTEIKEIELREHHLQDLERRRLHGLSPLRTATNRTPDPHNSGGATLLQHIFTNSQFIRNILIHQSSSNSPTSDSRTCRCRLRFFRHRRSRLFFRTHFQLLCRPQCLHITLRHFRPLRPLALTRVYH